MKPNCSKPIQSSKPSIWRMIFNFLPFYNISRKDNDFLKKQKIYWVIRESEFVECCTAVLFYDREENLIHTEEIPTLKFHQLNDKDLHLINQKARLVLNNQILKVLRKKIKK